MVSTLYTQNLSVSLSKALNMLDSMRNTSAVGSLEERLVNPTMSEDRQQHQQQGQSTSTTLAILSLPARLLLKSFCCCNDIVVQMHGTGVRVFCELLFNVLQCCTVTHSTMLNLWSLM